MIESRATNFGSPFRRLTLSLVLCLLLIPTLASAQAVIKISDTANVKFGVLMQGWADAQQDAVTRGYIDNLFLRRFRFLVGGQINPNLSFFFETDNPNLGKAPKALGSGFITQDAFMEWKPAGSSAFMIDAGLMLPPLCRNCLESAASLLSLDYGSFSFTESAATQSSVGRDTGFQAKGYLDKGHLEYRAGVFQGFRQTASPGHTAAGNSMRTTGRLQYNVWDTETGYVYPGFYLGNKKILAFGGGLDHQADYKAFSVDALLSIPDAAKNAFNGEITLLSFDGGKTFTTIPKQRDVTLQLGYYLSGPKVQPFVRFEDQNFSASANDSKDNKRIQAGLAWLPNGHNFNIKGVYSRVDPRVGNTTNEFTIQLQLFYY